MVFSDEIGRGDRDRLADGELSIDECRETARDENRIEPQLRIERQLSGRESATTAAETPPRVVRPRPDRFYPF
ncbi:hypothetical protein EA462_15350 [Natrarchaeobius halalkaliphilus]|uniref:Uncharacterized protein n=1 Tax=Natrarchaeobius halalkaliphilus TaxID=1679091 RepID=A0A3N6LKN1_9EURY|nr:hypothetical protein EA462_15350 [Natrarchaeobius halalkaliphilus]